MWILEVRYDLKWICTDGVFWSEVAGGLDLENWEEHYISTSPIMALDLHQQFRGVPPRLQAIYMHSMMCLFAGFTPVPGPACLDSLGMESGKIPDSDITASSFRSELSAPHFARYGIFLFLGFHLA